MSKEDQVAYIQLMLDRLYELDEQVVGRLYHIDITVISDLLLETIWPENWTYTPRHDFGEKRNVPEFLENENEQEVSTKNSQNSNNDWENEQESNTNEEQEKVNEKTPNNDSDTQEKEEETESTPNEKQTIDDDSLEDILRDVLGGL